MMFFRLQMDLACRLLVVFSSCVLLALSCLTSEAQPSQLIIRGVTVVDVVDGKLDQDRTVLIEGRKISAIGFEEEVHVPAAADVVDGKGKYLIPGLWDMHVHSAANVDWHFPLFLAYGVTGVRNLHSTVDTALALTENIQRRLQLGELRGPRFLANGPIVEGEAAVYAGSSAIARTAAEGRAVVDSLVDGGADFIKVYHTLTRETYFAVVDQARRRGVRAAGHVPFRIRPEEAARAGQASDEHMGGLMYGCSTRSDSVRNELMQLEEKDLPYREAFVAGFKLIRALLDSRDPDLCRATLEVYREEGMVVVPTLVVNYNNENAQEVLADSASMRLIPKDMRAWWTQTAGGPVAELTRPTRPARRDNIRLIKDAGVTLLAGTDLGNPRLVPGLSLHQELVLLSEAGLSPLEALQTATLNPARYLEATDSLGTVNEGKLADLVLLDENPLDDIANTQRISAVIRDGNLYTRADLDRLLAEVVALHQSENHD